MLNRKQTADLLKGIAVILMIQVHILELFADPTIYNGIVAKGLLFLGGPPVAPLFMVVFGYFIADSKKTTMQLIIRGLKIFGLGMVLNIALNFNLIISVLRGKYAIDLFPYLFGVDILHFAGICIIVIALLKNWLNQYPGIFFLLALISSFLGSLLLRYLPSNEVCIYLNSYFYGCSRWSYFPLLPWLAYPLAGYGLYHLERNYSIYKKMNNSIQLALLALLSVATLFTFSYALDVASDLPSYYHHGMKFFIWTLSFLALYALIASKAENWMGKSKLFLYLKWVGEHVTVIYIFQWIIIGNITTPIYKTISSPWILIGSFIGVVLISSCLTLVALKLKNRLLKK